MNFKSYKSRGTQLLVVWLQLLRTPNLLTVPGDPIAGYLLATGKMAPETWMAAIASLCFYCAGLLTNELADFEIDRKERPYRPLPSGRVKKQTVLIVGIILFLLGELLCFFLGQPSAVVGLGLVAAILAYNFKLKKISILGPLSMGFCRGLSLALGYSAAAPLVNSAMAYPGALIGERHLFVPMMLAPPLFLTLYVAIVTQLARNEMAKKPLGMKRWMPLGSLITCLIAIEFSGSMGPLLGENIFFFMFTYWPLGFAILIAMIAARRLASVNEKTSSTFIPGTIGLMISNLLFIQAFFAWPMIGLQIGGPHFLNSIFTEPSYPHVTYISFFLIGLWPVNRLLARWFYAS